MLFSLICIGFCPVFLSSVDEFVIVKDVSSALNFCCVVLSEVISLSPVIFAENALLQICKKNTQRCVANIFNFF